MGSERSPTAPETRRLAPPTQAEVGRVKIDGLQVVFRRTGAGPAIVLLHGILQDSRAWQRQIDVLSGSFAVVAWDAPGCGGSADPPDHWRLPEYADCLAAFIRQLGLGRPHVVGLSLGGALALELYRRHPGLPKTLVLAGAYAGWAGSLPPEVVEQRLAQAIREADQPPDRFVPGWIDGLLTEGAPQALVAEVIALMSDFHPAGYRAMARGMAEADLRDVLPRIDIPTLLLHGDADRRSSLSVAEGLRAAIPTSELIVLADAGHLSNMETADQFNAALRAFLDRVKESP